MKRKKYLLFDPKGDEGNRYIAIIVDREMPLMCKHVEQALKEHFDAEVEITSISTDTRLYGKEHDYVVSCFIAQYDEPVAYAFVLTGVTEY